MSETKTFDLGDTPIAVHMPKVVIGGPPPPPDGYWYTREVLENTGWSITQFRSLAKRGLVASAKRGTNGYHLYPSDRIKELKRQIDKGEILTYTIVTKKEARKEELKHGYTVSVSKSIFEALRSGKTLAEVSRIHANIHPRDLMIIFKDFLRVENAVIVSAGMMRKINGLDLDCAMPIKTEQGLYEALNAAVKDRCRSCSRGKSSYCDRCIRKRVLKSLTPRQRYGREPVPDTSDEDETELSKSAE